MTYSETIFIKTKGFSDIINLTTEVHGVLKRSKIENGLVTVFCPGSTGAVTTIEYESGVLRDYQKQSSKLPHRISLMSMINGGAMAMVFLM